MAKPLCLQTIRNVETAWPGGSVSVNFCTCLKSRGVSWQTAYAVYRVGVLSLKSDHTSDSVESEFSTCRVACWEADRPEAVVCEEALSDTNCWNSWRVGAWGVVQTLWPPPERSTSAAPGPGAAGD